MLTRRDWLAYSAAGAATLAMDPAALLADTAGGLLQRPIPSTGERLPIIGLGSSASFSSVAGSDDSTALRDVLRTLAENGGSVFDTAPSYGDAEAVAGRYVQELGLGDDIFWATKVNVVARGSDAKADPAAARAQIERSFGRIGKDVIDLIQVHNLADIPTQLGILKELKEAGRVRYIGTTSTDYRHYDYLEQVMRDEPLDFIGVDYAVDNLDSARRILPLAADRGIAVLLYRPFGRARLWQRTAGVPLPDWAAEFDATSWAQFFLKFVAAHPAVTSITPATSKPQHMLDNLAGGSGRLPDRAMQQRMIEFVDALPGA